MWRSLWCLVLVGPMVPAGVATAAESQAQRQQRSRIGLRAGVRDRARQRNPLLDMYRSWALHYEKDAREAEAAAEQYTAMTQAIASSGSSGAAAVGVKQELSKLKAKDLANKIWDFEAKLRDPRPVKAAKAAAEAQAPYREEWKEYVGARNSYLGAAAQHALRVKSNTKLMQQLRAYSEQNRIEGNAWKAKEYASQADALMKQVSSEEGLARDYEGMAKKISGVLPYLWKMQFTAADFAAYQENPSTVKDPMGKLPATQLVPYTVAPPPMDLVAQAYAAQAMEAAKAGLAAPR